VSRGVGRSRERRHTDLAAGWTDRGLDPATEPSTVHRVERGRRFSLRIRPLPVGQKLAPVRLLSVPDVPMYAFTRKPDGLVPEKGVGST
jgi:hypothetical protein